MITARALPERHDHELKGSGEVFAYGDEGFVQGVAPVGHGRQAGPIPLLVRQDAVRRPWRGPWEGVGRRRLDPRGVESHLGEDRASEYEPRRLARTGAVIDARTRMGCAE